MNNIKNKISILPLVGGYVFPVLVVVTFVVVLMQPVYADSKNTIINDDLGWSNRNDLICRKILMIKRN